MRSMQLRLVLAIVVVAACGDDGGSAIDATPTVDIDNGSCGDQLRFTGELVDWDSTDAMFCGINDADLQGGGAMDSTSPNGRFDLCLPRSMQVTLLDVTPPTGMSSCTSPPGTYALPGIAVANQAVILAGGFWSGRVFTSARQQSFFQSAGLVFDQAKAQVVVHVDGPQRGVAITATHGTTQAFSGTGWAAGETGRDVFFPNVDVGVGGGSTTLTVVGGAIGTGSIPLSPGKITYVTVRAQ